MDNTTVIGSGKLPSEGVNAPRKKKLSLSWWRQQKKHLLQQASNPNAELDACCSSDDNTNEYELDSVVDATRPSSSSKNDNSNRYNNNMMKQNFDGETVHFLCSLMQSKNWPAVQKAINLDPDLAYKWFSKVDDSGKLLRFLPIHAAISLKAPSVVIEELLSLHPGSALSPDDNGRVPLHLAVLHEATFEVFEKLLSVSPEAVDVSDIGGKTPLHLHLEAFYNNRKKLITDDSEQPMKKKLKPELGVVELCSKDSIEFICRFSCQEKFGSQSLRQEHEKLCWLKLPYGSIWTCEYCGVGIRLLSYSSVVHHEGKCNPLPTLQSSVSGKPPFQDIPFIQNIKSVNMDAPICSCDYQPTYCATSVSSSERNPGKKYFRCSKLNVEDRCRFFQWLKDERNG